VTAEQRGQLITTLRNLAKSMERVDEERDTATAACLYGLCLAIHFEVEVELAHHISLMNLNTDTEIADAAIEAGDERTH
jgi:molybdopterin converting factor small subunit